MGKAFRYMLFDLIMFFIALGLAIPLILFIFLCIIFPPFLCVCCLIVPVYLLIFIYLELVSTAAQRFMILNNESAIESIQHGWEFTKVHFQEYLIAALVSLLPAFLWAIITGIISFIGTIIVVIVLIASFEASTVVGILAAVLVLIPYILIMAVLNAPYIVYAYTYWTKVVIELMDRK